MDQVDGYFKTIERWKPIYTSEPKPGKVLIFPSKLFHAPGFCTQGKRVVVNLIMKITNVIGGHNESLSIASVPE